MPADAPQTLSAQETADILAYVLSLNKCPPGEKDLPSDTAALGQVRITSRPDPRQAVAEQRSSDLKARK